jgi:hypothetical protein
VRSRCVTGCTALVLAPLAAWLLRAWPRTACGGGGRFLGDGLFAQKSANAAARVRSSCRASIAIIKSYGTRRKWPSVTELR